MGYLFLAVAICFEVVATLSLRLTTTAGAKWWVYAIVVGGYVVSFAALQQTLARGVPLAIAYAIWSAVGVVVVALFSWLVFKEPLTPVQIGGMVLVIAGVALLELGGREHAS